MANVCTSIVVIAIKELLQQSGHAGAAEHGLLAHAADQLASRAKRRQENEAALASLHQGPPPTPLPPPRGGVPGLLLVLRIFGVGATIGLSGNPSPIMVRLALPLLTVHSQLLGATT